MKRLGLCVAAMAGALTIVGSAAAFEPKNVECIAPSTPGGGWDFTCRQVGKILYDLKLVPEPVKVTNQTGGGGGVAYGYVVSKRNTDANLIVAASTATTSRLAQNQFAGLTADQVRWLVSLGADFGVITVREDSPYKNLKDLVEAIRADPAKVPFGGGSSVGGWDHLKVLLLAKAAGIQNLKAVKYVYFDSGGGALTQLLGGHVAAMTGDISEMKGQLAAGNVRVLGVLSPERLQSRPEIPTAKEQGYDVVGANWRGFYIPGGVSADVHKGWGAIMEKLYNSKEWQDAMVANDLEPFWNDSTAFPKFVQQNIKELQELSAELGVIK